MRPGQAAPVFPRLDVVELGGRNRFNEAGAGCPGILIENPIYPMG